VFENVGVIYTSCGEKEDTENSDGLDQVMFSWQLL
jgi:hypothetical protein